MCVAKTVSLNISFFGSIFVGIVGVNYHGIGWNWSDSGSETPTTPSHLSPGHTCGRSPELLTQRPGPLLWSTQVFSTSLLHSWNLSPSDSTSTNSRLAMSTFLLVVVSCSYMFLSLFFLALNKHCVDPFFAL